MPTDVAQPDDLLHIILRVCDSNGATHGTAFLLAPDLAVTCAHVVTACGTSAGQEIQVVFHVGSETGYATVISEWWDEPHDIAFLRLSSKLCKNVPVLPVGSSGGCSDHRIRTFGYPAVDTPGLWGKGTVTGPLDEQGRHLLQLDSTEITTGFSGAPIWDVNLQQIIGMATAILRPDETGRLVSVALATPAELLGQICPHVQVGPGPKKVNNPFVPLTGIVDDLKLFFDRDQEIKDVFEILNCGSSVAVIGERAVGKSSLLHAIHRQAATHLTVPRTPIYINLEIISDQKDFFDALCGQVGIPTLQGFKLFKALKEHRTLLILDEVEKMTWKGFTREFRSQLRGLAQGQGKEPPLRLILAARTPLDDLFSDSCDKDMTSPLENLCVQVTVGRWSEWHIRAFINSRLSKTGIQFSEEEILKILGTSEGHPQRVMRACFEVFRGKTA